ncbi:phosphoglycerate mutase family [Moniliophthora roreri MCA 2997]|uniref:Phosphoglycerate mutase family n=1 Tax=Moniliophthora roreri (strain MCA 2997) TaxID=1381753 RepID=V2XIS9_MONRO|nr:phosphoglycerate mutase family [Moniliophthora roreri MCA 2997]
MPSLFRSLSIFALLTGYLATAAKTPYYIITNAETPSFNRPGLTPVGQRRANDCIPGLFSRFNIGMIISCTVDRDGEEGLGCPSAVETATPLATLLGLNVTTCGTGEESNDECVHNKIQKFNKASNQSVLIVWDASDMDNLLENADVNDAGIDEDTIGMQ